MLALLYLRKVNIYADLGWLHMTPDHDEYDNGDETQMMQTRK